jgi:hypothetical protein
MEGPSSHRSACIATAVCGIPHALPLCAPAALLLAPAPGIRVSWSSGRHFSGTTEHPLTSACCKDRAQTGWRRFGIPAEHSVHRSPRRLHFRAISARYDFALGGYDAFAQIGAVHQSHPLASTNQFTTDLQDHRIACELRPFTTFDGALGVGKDAWLSQFYGENLTDTRAQVFANYSQDYKAVTVKRPRTIGLRIGYKFSAR